jgi:hypothetical protein
LAHLAHEVGVLALELGEAVRHHHSAAHGAARHPVELLLDVRSHGGQDKLGVDAAVA